VTSSAGISRLTECKRHDRLNRVLTNLGDEAAGLGVDLELVDRVVQIELADMEEKGPRFRGALNATKSRNSPLVSAMAAALK
jgi:hypothetical protein